MSAGSHILIGQLESLRNLAWLLVLYRLFASDGRHATPSPVRPVIFAASFVELLYLAASMVLFRNIGPSDARGAAGTPADPAAPAGDGGRAGAGPQPLSGRDSYLTPDPALAGGGAGGDLGL